MGQNPKASQKWVKPQEETHVTWAQNHAGLAPQSGKIACARNPPHKKALLSDSAHLQLLSALGIFGIFRLFGLDTLDIRTVLLPLRKARHASTTIHTCVVVVEACLALRCWQQNHAGVKPISATRQALGLRWKSPKWTIFEMCTVPQKCLFVWGISCTSYLSALGSQARTVLFSSDMSFLLGFDPFLGSLWILSHIDKKCAPRMPYKLMSKGMVYHYSHMCASGTPCLCPRAYKACMGRISCRCGTESKSFSKMGRTRGGNSRRLRTKPRGLDSLKRTNSLYGKSPTQKPCY